MLDGSSASSVRSCRRAIRTSYARDGRGYERVWREILVFASRCAAQSAQAMESKLCSAEPKPSSRSSLPVVRLPRSAAILHERPGSKMDRRDFGEPVGPRSPQIKEPASPCLASADPPIEIFV